MKRTGFAIILVLATLVLLAMLSLTYIKLALIDRNIARNYMDNKRAKLIAQSGIDYAIARVQEDPVGTGWQNLATKSININGVNTNYTESSGSTYGENRDLFSLKVSECNSMINVNDGLNNPRVRANTRRILNALGDLLGIATLGDKIINNRPAQGYASKQELLKYVTNNEFNTIKSLVTTNAWQDEVANPVPLSSDVIDVYPVQYNTNIAGKNIYRYGRSWKADGDPLTTPLLFAPHPSVTLYATLASSSGNTYPTSVNFDFAIWGLDELNPQWIEIVKRSPINVNLADTNILKTLLTDLKGFFCIERPINRPEHYDAYTAAGYWRVSDYGPSASSEDNDNLAFLYTTDVINPTVIAEEIRACIEERVSLNPPNINYSTLWFKGSFKTWRQFNAFCDYLVEKDPTNPKVLKETRSSIFYEYYAWKEPKPKFVMVDWCPWKDGMRNSSYALKIASQAMADVLKANFNPNLHLNELNPDANIRTLVDKTDLIVNSTEFCFTSMGHFQMESEGFVLKPDGLDNRVIANEKIEAVARVFNVLRHTNEAQFLWSDNIADMLVSTTSPTNNAMTLEIGPEPMQTLDAGGNIVARKNEYSGHIALPTLKGPDSGAGLSSAVIICHFTKDFKADKHADNQKDNLTDHNIADKYAGVVQGPYVYGGNAGKYLLAKSFREGDGKSLNNYAMSDLRTDGAYVERFAGLAYSYSGNILKNAGVASYWIKPWFMPEMTGKERTYLSLSKFIDDPSISSLSEYRYFTNWFLPSHVDFSNPNNIEPTCETFAPEYYDDNPWTWAGAGWTYKYAFHPMSFLFGFNLFGTSSGNENGGIGRNTPTLNHIAHSTHAQKNYMKAGQWVHVTFTWTISTKATGILINGVPLASTSTVDSHSADLAATAADYLVSTRLRIGEPGRSSGVDCPPNWTCDSTIDEFYMFDSATGSSVSTTDIWQKGRYYKPVASPLSEYTSVNLTEGLLSKFPSESTITSPGPAGPTASSPASTLKIIGLAWTWFAEDVDANGNPILRNYKDHDTVADFNSLPALEPDINIYLKKNADTYGPFNLEGFQGVNIQIESELDVLRYKVRFTWKTAPANDAILLYSPLFDDISIYYKGGVQFLSYSQF